MDEWPSSPTSLALSSPRRTLSLLRERKGGRAHISISDPGSPVAAGFAHDNGPKPGEVYGFVGSITTIIATVVYLVWAYTPEPWLHALGITYYPSKYWALAIPAFAMVTVVLGLVFYLGLNFMITPPPTSYNTMFARPDLQKSSIREFFKSYIEIYFFADQKFRIFLILAVSTSTIEYQPRIYSTPDCNKELIEGPYI